MKLLLTSGGIKNNSIRNALVSMLGKPIEQSTALFIPTAAHALGPFLVWRATHDFVELPWKEFGVLELTALPSIPQEHRLPKLEAADALLVGGGDPLYLCYWMQQSGLADLLPGLRETVYVGLSAGSLVMTPNIGDDFVRWKPPTGGDRTLRLVDFAMYPHLDHEALPENTMANAESGPPG
jgi:dipeptidase E